MSATAGRTRRSGHYLRARLRSAPWAWRAAVFAVLVLAASVLVFRLGGLDFRTLKLLFATVAGLSAFAILAGLGGLVRVWRSGCEGGGRALAALCLGLCAAAPFAVAGLLAFSAPRTGSAETDGMLAADTVSEESLSEAMSPDNPAGPPAPDGEAGGPLLSGRRFQARAAQVYAVTRLVLADEGWDIAEVATGAPAEDAPDPGGDTGDLGVSGTVDVPLPTARSSVDPDMANDPFDREDSDEYAVQAVAKSPVLALPSAVTIRIVEDGADTFVDLRSTSQVVAWDLGQNRRFIEDFLARLDAGMAGVAAIVPDS